MIKLELNFLNNIDLNKVDQKYHQQLNKIKQNFVQLKHPMMGWINYFESNEYQNDLIQYKKIKEIWKKLKINTVVVIGIGGSYNGIKAATDFLSGNKKIDFIYLSEISSKTLNDLPQVLKNKNWSIVVISKSGTTLETSINFRIVREWLFLKYKDKYAKRIVAITSSNQGILNDIANKQKYFKLVIPNNIGGRYSALTSVGLFLLFLKDINIELIKKGYLQIINYFIHNNYQNNLILQYVAFRDYLNKQKQLDVEVFQVYDESQRYIAETYKQLFAESEGKKQKTIIPTISVFSNDLHSIGQLYQQGCKNFFQTTLYINSLLEIKIPKSSFKNDDQLDYLHNKTIEDIKDKLKHSVLQAHAIEAKNQNILIEFYGEDQILFGEIYAFLSLAAATSSYLNNVDPFNQPGVENYKQNLKKILK